jgi:hypothetical protein
MVLTLAALLSACGGRVPSVSNFDVTPTPSASPYQQIIESGEETASPEKTPAPKAFSVEELLSAAELETFIGYPVKATFDPLEVSDTGIQFGSYEYDIPIEGISVTDSYITSLDLIQNGMISSSELEKGHDAKWAFEDFKTTFSDRVVDCTVRGVNAFYVTVNSDVHVLFQDYYVVVSFRIDDTDFNANLELNKSIASFIIDKISLQ